MASNPLKHKISLFILIAIVLAGCNLVDSKMERLTIDDEFTIDIPVYMEEMTVYDESALAQYGSEYHEHYVGLIREPNDIAIPGYEEVSLEVFAMVCEENAGYSLGDYQSEKLDDTYETRNEMESVSYRTTGIFTNEKEQKLPLVYYNMYYKGKDYFYIVTTWTIADREIKFQKNMRHIVESLKEL